MSAGPVGHRRGNWRISRAPLQITPSATIARATLMNPAMLAPFT
jgi:hypothetical protein